MKTVAKVKNALFALSLFCVTSAAFSDAYDNYSLKALENYAYKGSPITITGFVAAENGYYAYNYQYQSMGLRVSGRYRVPAGNVKGVILMFRGHQFERGYYTGKGTENIGRRFLEAGYAVIAPDFLGYAESDPTPEPTQAHQLYSAVNAVELYLSLQNPAYTIASGVTLPAAARSALPTQFRAFGVWGHSNGGQVAVHFLELLKKPIPAILWAPVTLDYPDNVGHYGRNPQWAADFKASHTAADYALSLRLGNIAALTPILLEQGTRDVAVPQKWSDDFAAAIARENEKRPAAAKIKLAYQLYNGANHDLVPGLETVWARDLKFWQENL